MNTTLHAEKPIALNVEGVRASLRYMPPGTYRFYCNWVLNNPQVASDWLQLVGILGLSKLTVSLIGSLVTSQELETLLPYTVPINISQMYEVVSDNLALGLARQLPGDSDRSQRRHLLRAFNKAMITRLSDPDSPSTIAALSPYQTLMAPISTFQQSLSKNKHIAIADAFLDEYPAFSLREIEYSLFPSLVANIDTTLELVQAIAGCHSESLVRDGLIRRYSGVERLLAESVRDFDRLVEIGIDSIMVIPTLAYYAAVIGELVRPLAHFQDIILDHSLETAVQDAACCVRLLNDLGTVLLETTDFDNSPVIDALRAEGDSRQTLYDLLASLKFQALTRVQKDVTFGEFNVCLTGLDEKAPLSETVEAFWNRVQQASQIYRFRRSRMQSTLKQITAMLDDNIISEMIEKFVDFHRFIYTNRFTDADGEYAV